MEKLNIIFTEDPSRAEVVDSLADLFQAADIAEDTLEDGWDWSDAFAVVQVQPIVAEVVNDFPVFMAQFGQLHPSIAKTAVIEARQQALTRRSGDLGRITTLISRFLLVAANNYEFAVSTYNNGQSQYLLWTTLLSGEEVFPPAAPQT
ncbi:MAG: hypothetical protein AAFQ01_01340 [Bacteroidota bacterium]